MPEVSGNFKQEALKRSNSAGNSTVAAAVVGASPTAVAFCCPTALKDSSGLACCLAHAADTRLLPQGATTMLMLLLLLLLLLRWQCDAKAVDQALDICTAANTRPTTPHALLARCFLRSISWKGCNAGIFRYINAQAERLLGGC